MTTKITNHKKDDAVSPVVGVMLMLVVTIVIAAVVALFATSVVTDTNAAPVAVIETNAYYGEPLENGKLVMGIIGGKALELSKLKCVVTLEDGKYGMVFKSLDTDPLVGKFLEIGEQLEIMNMDYAGGGMRKINSLVGGDINNSSDCTKIFGMFMELKVGDKVNVMIVFDENAILYKKDIIIQDGAHQKQVTLADDENVTWTINQQEPTSSDLLISWDSSTVTAKKATTNAAPSWLVTIKDTNGTGELDLQVTPAEGKAITAITAAGMTVEDGNSVTVSGSFALAAVTGDLVTGITVNLASSTIAPEKTSQATAEITPTGASTTVTWSSSDSSVATVDGDTGLITGVAAGTATITATATDGSGTTGTADITVATITVTLASTVAKGSTATASFSSNPSGAITSVKWSSDDESVAKVDPSTGVVTGVAEGGATITATAADSGITGTAPIKVTGS